MEELSVGSKPQLIHNSWLEMANTALGTCFPAPVSEKKVLKESSPPPTALSDGIVPSG